jgi:hypothetical protein
MSRDVLRAHAVEVPQIPPKLRPIGLAPSALFHSITATGEELLVIRRPSIHPMP